MKPQIIVGLLSLVAGACQPSSEPGTLQKLGSPTAYQLCSAAELPAGISLRVGLDTTENSGLEATLELCNQQSDTLQLQLSETELLLPGGRAYRPENALDHPSRLAPGQTNTFQLHYRPVHDPQLYHQTGLSGSYLPAYRLTLHYQSPAGPKTDILEFCMDEQSYTAYQNQAAASAPRIYYAQSHANAAAEQQAYWMKHTSQPGTAQFSEQEYFVGGINMRHVLYQRDDSLHLNIRVVNHGTEAIYLIPAEIRLQRGGQNISAGRQPAADSVVLGKGNRWQGAWTFPADSSLKNLKVQYGGIRLFGSRVPWLKEEVTYELTQ